MLRLKKILRSIAHYQRVSSFLAIVFLLAGANDAYAKTDNLGIDSSEHFYSIIAMGCATVDSLGSFPVPIVILEPADTNRFLLRLRFHHLGILGIATDTVTAPIGIGKKGDRTYRANHPVLQLHFPEMIYSYSIDVFDRKTNRMLESKLRPYLMKLGRYRNARMIFESKPTTGLGSEFLQRKFVPRLLPLTLSTNPGWRVIETIDSAGVYAIQFVDPKDSNLLYLSLTVTPTDDLERFDSTRWEGFKEQARVAFGAKQVRINSLSDFGVEDPATRSVVQRGYEFLAKDPLQDISYVATYRTPRAVILMLAPLGNEVIAEKLAYCRAIAKSLLVR